MRGGQAVVRHVSGHRNQFGRRAVGVQAGGDAALRRSLNFRHASLGLLARRGTRPVGHGAARADREPAASRARPGFRGLGPAQSLSMLRLEGMAMTDANEALVREACEAYGRGDVARMLDFVDPDLEWIYLNPAFEDPEPETCHGREQLRWALERQAERRLASQVEEVVAFPVLGSGACQAPARGTAPG